MTHPRKTIRDAIQTALTGLTTTGSNVFQNRVFPFESGDFPGLLIYNGDEESEPGGNDAGVQTFDRQYNCMVEGYVKAASASIDDTLDSIAEEIETAIAADRTLSGACGYCFTSATEFEFNADQNKRTGIVRLTLTVLYRSTI